MMVENVSFLLPYAVLASHAVFLIFFLSLVFRNNWGKNVSLWLGKHALGLALLVTLAAVAGSLFYSEIVGFEACMLCWWQRVFLYPLVIIFGIAFWKKHTSAFLYAVPFALIAAFIALYHSFVQLGGTSLIPCTNLGGDCARIYVLAFNYITIPTMSLTIAIYVLILAWANKIYSAR